MGKRIIVAGLGHGGIAAVSQIQRGKEIIARDSNCGDAQEQDYVEALPRHKVAEAFHKWFFHAFQHLQAYFGHACGRLYMKTKNFEKTLDLPVGGGSKIRYVFKKL